MATKAFYPFHPERFFYSGIAILGGAFLVLGSVFLAWQMKFEPMPKVPLSRKVSSNQEAAPLSFSVGLKKEVFSIPKPSLEREISFSYDPVRPDSSITLPPLSIRCTRSGNSKRVPLPSRVDLKYDREGLSFSETASLFWAELEPLGDSKIAVRVFLSDPKSNSICEGNFSATTEDPPIRTPNEIPEQSPFRILAEARWWGHDLFQEKYGGRVFSQRLELGSISNPELLEIQGDDWIAWIDGKWQKIFSISGASKLPIARIVSCEGKSLILEGWEGDTHLRLSYNQAQMLPFKVKAEDLFASLRIRSEKQISCTLEKQCLILKIGDWVLKKENRWKILRKKEDREAFVSGKWIGELFVFEKIEMRGGQKFVQGLLFNAGRSQAAPIEMAVTGQRKSREKNPFSSNKSGRMRAK